MFKIVNINQKKNQPKIDNVLKIPELEKNSTFKHWSKKYRNQSQNRNVIRIK